MDENKKPGQRDISDLKARLGLKKTGVMPAVSPSGQPVAPAPGAPVPAPIPAPPGAAAPVPPPPGIPSPFGQPAQPAAPAAPAVDPQVAAAQANLAAFYGINQVLPGSTEGVNAEPISKPKPWGRIGMIGGIALAFFIVGNACGRVYGTRVEFNRTIDQAVGIRTEIDKVQKQVTSINDLIMASAPTKAGQPDFELAKKLADLDLTKPDTQKLFKTNYAHLEDVAIERLFTYYDSSIKLFDMVTAHAKKTEADKDSIESFMKSGGKGDKNFGMILDGSGPVPVAKMVEIGQPVCADKASTDCSAKDLVGFKYRQESGAGWSERPLKGKPTETVTPIQQTPFFKSIASGNPDILAYKDYLRRLADIKKLAGEISASQKEVVGDLKRAAERPKVFTF